MLNTDERLALVDSRARARRRTNARRGIAVLSSSCAVLIACIAGIGALLADPVAADVVGLYGASLLFNGVGGYVVVGLVCFAAAVALTLGCISYRRKAERRNRYRNRSNRNSSSRNYSNHNSNYRSSEKGMDGNGVDNE